MLVHNNNKKSSLVSVYTTKQVYKYASIQFTRTQVSNHTSRQVNKFKRKQVHKYTITQVQKNSSTQVNR